MAQLAQHEPGPTPELLTVKEAAAALGGWHVETVNRWARTGKIPCVKLPGRRRMFRRDVIDAILSGEEAA
jgi:excisionase family DNA binding protein